MVSKTRKLLSKKRKENISILGLRITDSPPEGRFNVTIPSFFTFSQFIDLSILFDRPRTI